MNKNENQTNNYKKDMLAELIKKDLQGGSYSLGDVIESERRLSERYDVSRVTVRSAINILEAQGVLLRYPRLGAVVTSIPRADQCSCEKPAEKHVGEIVFLRLGSNPWTSDISLGYSQYCSEHGQVCRIVDFNGSHQRLLEYLDKPSQGTAGVVLVAYDNVDYKKTLQRLADIGVEVVLLERTIEGSGLSSVSVDNFTGGYLATNHLLERFGRGVFHIGKHSGSSSLQKRMEGWKSALTQQGFGDTAQLLFEIDVRDEVLATDFDAQIKAGYEAAKKILTDEHKQKGGWSIFAAKDLIAAGVYKAAQELSLEVGREVAVVGFGDSPMTKHLTPPMSSVYRVRSELGYAAAKLARKLIAERSHTAVHEVMPVKLMIRESSLGE